MACLRAKPIVDGLEAEWRDRAQVVRLNTFDQESRPLLARLGMRATPTYVILDSNGREVWRAVGVINAAEARRAMETAH